MENQQLLAAAMQITLCLRVLVLVGSANVHAQAPESLRHLFESGRVFALRDAVQHAGAPLFDFTLDTGAVDTDLNPIFAKELPALVSSGQKETHKITGLGGSNKLRLRFASLVSSSDWR
jgi:hypothetical protein